METRKEREIKYYDQKASEQARNFSAKESSTDFEDFNPAVLNSFSFCYALLEKNCPGRKILDYGCGNGVHSLKIAGMKPEKVIGIDLSEKSLEIARRRISSEGLESVTELLKMDCEKMDFSEKYFDVIFDGGTFSSLDIKKAFPELARVLKNDGLLIGIETFGHNPFTNLKRKINKITGKRTGWAVDHIFRQEDLKEAEKYFGKIESRFFHLTSWAAFPFINLPGGRLLLKALELLDSGLLKVPFLKKYGFKTVFIFSQPKYND